MIGQLIDTDISTYWPLLKACVEGGLPSRRYEDSEETQNRILSGLLVGALQAWVVHDNEKILVLLITGIVEDPWGQNRMLSVYGADRPHVKDIPDETLMEAFQALQVYARKNGCQAIIGVTSHPLVIKLFQAAGGDTSQTFVVKEV